MAARRSAVWAWMVKKAASRRRRWAGLERSIDRPPPATTRAVAARMASSQLHARPAVRAGQVLVVGRILVDAGRRPARRQSANSSARARPASPRRRQQVRAIPKTAGRGRDVASRSAACHASNGRTEIDIGLGHDQRLEAQPHGGRGVHGGQGQAFRRPNPRWWRGAVDQEGHHLVLHAGRHREHVRQAPRGHPRGLALDHQASAGHTTGDHRGRARPAQVGEGDPGLQLTGPQLGHRRVVGAPGGGQHAHRRVMLLPHEEGDAARPGQRLLHLPHDGRRDLEQVGQAGVGQQSEVGPGNDLGLVGRLCRRGQHRRHRSRGGDQVGRWGQDRGSTGRGRMR